MNEQQESPIQEAISYITIAAIIIGAVLFYAGMHNVPVLSWALYHVAVWIYGLIPAIRGPALSPGASSGRRGNGRFSLLDYRGVLRR
jgi:uncharacterized membrane protein YiaA